MSEFEKFLATVQSSRKEAFSEVDACLELCGRILFHAKEICQTPNQQVKEKNTEEGELACLELKDRHLKLRISAHESKQKVLEFKPQFYGISSKIDSMLMESNSVQRDIDQVKHECEAKLQSLSPTIEVSGIDLETQDHQDILRELGAQLQQRKDRASETDALRKQKDGVLRKLKEKEKKVEVMYGNISLQISNVLKTGTSRELLDSISSVSVDSLVDELPAPLHALYFLCVGFKHNFADESIITGVSIKKQSSPHTDPQISLLSLVVSFSLIYEKKPLSIKFSYHCGIDRVLVLLEDFDQSQNLQVLANLYSNDTGAHSFAVTDIFTPQNFVVENSKAGRPFFWAQRISGIATYLRPESEDCLTLSHLSVADSFIDVVFRLKKRVEGLDQLDQDVAGCTQLAQNMEALPQLTLYQKKQNEQVAQVHFQQLGSWDLVGAKFYRFDVKSSVFSSTSFICVPGGYPNIPPMIAGTTIERRHSSSKADAMPHKYGHLVSFLEQRVNAVDGSSAGTKNKIFDKILKFLVLFRDLASDSTILGSIQAQPE